jgi:WD40 repeat protein
MAQPKRKGVLQGHIGGVLCVAFSCTLQCRNIIVQHLMVSFLLVADGKYCISGGADRSVRLWNVGTEQCVSVFRSHSRDVLSVASYVILIGVS